MSIEIGKRKEYHIEYRNVKYFHYDILCDGFPLLVPMEYCVFGSVTVKYKPHYSSVLKAVVAITEKNLIDLVYYVETYFSTHSLTKEKTFIRHQLPSIYCNKTLLDMGRYDGIQVKLLVDDNVSKLILTKIDLKPHKLALFIVKNLDLVKDIQNYILKIFIFLI